MKPQQNRLYQSRNPVDMPSYKTTPFGANLTTPEGTVWTYIFTAKSTPVVLDYYEGHHLGERIGVITHDYIMKRPRNFDLNKKA